MAQTLQVLGAVGAAGFATTAILISDRRLRAVAMIAALALAGALICGEAWHGQLRDLRHHPLGLAAIVAAGAAAVGGLVAVSVRYPMAVPLLLIAALPFRIPIHAGGQSSNLLLPLYLVIAAGVAAESFATWRLCAGSDPGARFDRLSAPKPAQKGVRVLGIVLSASIVLYAAQLAYSSDVSRGVQNVAFFLVPFALMFVILRDTRWEDKLLRNTLLVIVGEAVIFALIGIVQHQTHHIFWNSKVMESNEFDLYFRVNSLFWDPNIYGRYLGLAILVGAIALLWIEQARRLAAGALALAVIFLGLCFSSSQTSLLALLVGLAVLCALRWSWRLTLAGVVLVAVAMGFVFTASNALDVNSQAGGELEQTTSGRSRLASGGLDIARDRPLWGYGSGSFAAEFERRNQVPSGEAVVSHTEPITIAAEQGAIGLLTYAALLLVSLAVVFGGLRALAPGLGGRLPPPRGPGSRGRAAAVGRIAVATAFIAMLVHTMGYAGFLIDPLTWALLAIGAALAASTPANAE